MSELWQLYDEQGQPIAGKGATKDEGRKGLLHAAAHVWIWRKRGDETEVLVQKRAGGKMTWPELYDVSAAGHVDLGEDPLDAAIRETKEEIGVELRPERLRSAGVFRWYVVESNTGIVENELQWIYTVQLQELDSTLQDTEVASIEWKTLASIKRETFDEEMAKHYVPHTLPYFMIVVDAIDRQAILADD